MTTTTTWRPNRPSGYQCENSHADGLRELGRIRSGASSVFRISLPVEFDRVPPGRWRAFAIANGAQRFATADIVVERERSAELALRFVPLEFVEGRVSPTPDTERRMSVAFTPPGWPIEAVEALLTHELGVDGSFRVAAPTPGELSLREGSQTIERRPARGGTPLVFTLPD